MPAARGCPASSAATRRQAGRRIDAVAGPGAISQILVVDGDLQTVAVGSWAGESLQIRVVDAFNNPLPDVPIDWDIVRGEADLEGASIGPLGGATQVTDGWGRCRLEVRPRMAGDLILEARVAGSEIPARFHLLARVPDPSGATSLEGEIVDDAGRPLSGVTVLVDGSTLGSVSDREGRFRVTGIRPGHRHLIVVGGTRGRGGTYLPTLGFEIEVARGVVNRFPGRISVPALDDSERVWVGGDEPVTIPMPGRPGWFIEVEPHATIRADGHRGPVEMWLAPVQPSASPMPLPAGERAAMMATLQPPGVRFDPPARVIIPNDLGAPRGADLELRSYDHDLGDWVTTGWSRVNDEGTSIVTAAGSGIVKSGWHMGVVPAKNVFVRGRVPDLTPGGGPEDSEDPGPDGQDPPPNGLTVDIEGKLRASLWRKAVCVARVQARSGTAEWGWNMMPTETPLGAIVDPEDPSSSPKRIQVAWTRPSRDAEDLALVRLAARSGSAMDEQILEIQVDPPGTSPTPAIVVPGQRTRLRIGPVPDLPKEELPILHWRATAEEPLAGGVRVDEDLTSPRPPEAGPAVPSTGKIGIVASTVVTVGGLPHLDLDLEVAPDLLPGVVDVSFTGHGIAPALWTVGTVPITLTVPPIAECLPRRSGTWDEPVIILDQDATLVGTVEGNQDRWRLRARATGADQIQWNVGSGILLRGTRTSPEIVVRYPPGHHVPTLVATKTLDGRTYTRHAAIHHLVVTKDRTAEDWRPVSGPVSDPYGSRSQAARAPGGDDLPKSSVAVWLEPSAQVRLSEDGYPQNEYWLGDQDLGTSPRLVRISPRGEIAFHVQGYGEPSQAVNDAVVLAQASRLLGPAPLDTAEFSTVALEIAVDANADGVVRFDASDQASVERPMRFWVNDDEEIEFQSDDPFFRKRATEADAVLTRMGTGRDATDEIIHLRRDLEDLFPLNLRLQGPPEVVTAIQASGLAFEAGLVPLGGGTPGSARLFASADGAGTLRYLADHQGVSREQVTETYRQSLGSLPDPEQTGGSFGQGWFGRSAVGLDRQARWRIDDPGMVARWQAQGQLPLLMEGIEPGRGSLRIHGESPLLGPNARLHGTPTMLHLSRFRDWYSVTTVDPPGLTAWGADPYAVMQGNQASVEMRSVQSNDTVLWIHGYNMPPAEKVTFRETAFKRLWWNGWRGRMRAFEWPTCYASSGVQGQFTGYPASVGDPSQSYNGFGRSERAAFLSGEKLAHVVRTWRQGRDLPSGSKLHLIAHSHGNVVVPNALRSLPAGSVQTWLALHAAIPVQAFGGTGPFPGVVLPENDPNIREWYGPVVGALGLPEPATGLDTPDLWPGYFDSFHSVGRIVSIFNVNDWALSRFVWEYANLRKPVMGWGGEHSYAYLRDPTPDPDAFPHRAPDGDGFPLQRFAKVRETLREVLGIPLISPTHYQHVIAIEPLSWLDQDSQALRGDWIRWLDPTAPDLLPVGWSLAGSYPLGLADRLRETLHHLDDRWVGSPHEMALGRVAAANLPSERHRQYEILAYAVESRHRTLGGVDIRSREVHFPLIHPDNRQNDLIDAHGLWNGIADDVTGRPPPEDVDEEDNEEREYAHHLWHSGCVLTTLSQQWRYWAQVAQILGVDRVRTLESVGIGPTQGGAP